MCTRCILWAQMQIILKLLHHVVRFPVSLTSITMVQFGLPKRTLGTNWCLETGWSDYTLDFHVIMRNSHCYQLFRVSIYADGKTLVKLMSPSCRLNQLDSNLRVAQRMHASVCNRNQSCNDQSDKNKLYTDSTIVCTVQQPLSYVHDLTFFTANWHIDTSACKVWILALHAGTTGVLLRITQQNLNFCQGQIGSFSRTQIA